MAYSEEQKTKIINDVLTLISDGMSLIKACKKVGLDRSMFYEWGINKSDSYARACDERAMLIFEESLEIADKQDKDVIEVDGIEVVNHNIIARNKLQIDTRKWFLSKMLPAKYGDKQEINHKNNGSSFQPPSIVVQDKDTADQIDKLINNKD